MSEQSSEPAVSSSHLLKSRSMITRCVLPISIFLAATCLAACSEAADRSAILTIDGANPETGRNLIQTYGCGTCHTIAGIRGARGRVGPELRDYSQQHLLAGFLPNAPRYLIAWLMDPVALKPQTGMPAQGLTEEEARHIASYLYTLGSGRTASYPPDPPPSLRREEPSLEKIDRTVTSPSDTTPRTRRIVPSQDGNVASPR
ncbi:cytochrome c [Microvirga subterranea]|uniref:Cytochrome c n=2 Tax=Microvirga subterranea TaxID=186651 RepID=A0A370HRE7_9HYPH|nr:cytochrome c [Microvirga subterranea]